MAASSIKHGTPGQLAGHDAGYSANGESQFSRRSASIKLSVGKRTDGRLMREMERALCTLKYKADQERDPAKMAKIEKNIRIKTAFIAKLKGQYDNEHSAQTSPAGSQEDREKPGSRSREDAECWDWKTVETIPGADDL